MSKRSAGRKAKAGDYGKTTKTAAVKAKPMMKPIGGSVTRLHMEPFTQDELRAVLAAVNVRMVRFLSGEEKPAFKGEAVALNLAGKKLQNDFERRIIRTSRIADLKNRDKARRLLSAAETKIAEGLRRPPTAPPPRTRRHDDDGGNGKTSADGFATRRAGRKH
jgi:hypothetical protein